ncbi:MAG: hypothetical protein NAG76_22425 [Candidatus Pristimantibacillus lignocellulolyticus]|uniref:Uncharacterized protein n=1 Tax=Candidatus Pristimantibacillus lignocellulolyticus TaxID=2994561 RepID=A0A9J6ZEF7_9BACL|nr:MAG: hypothetical protein NAG76_22425 [Candidatus Pristimantibacillus lignocellulolyticus]
MGTIIGFFFFSAIEGISIYFMTMSTFRLKQFKHINAFMPFMAVMISQSFFLREEVHLSFIAPILSLLIFILFFTLYLKIPLIWSSIITFVCYTAFGCIQWVLLEIFFGDIQTMNNTASGGYILQSITAIVQFFIAFILLRYRFGFVVDFEKLRFKIEHYITITMIIATIVSMVLTSFSNKAMIIIALSFMYFLFFAIRKEREQ